ncbi:MAG: addiction module protein [Thiomicrorhabdus sp.]|nr:addiction module protein [Thiomicrorhabdus sp.]
MITIQQKQLFDEVGMLPLDLKTKLVEQILNSINQTNASMDNLWIKEVNRRKQEVESGEATLINGEEVFQRIQQRLR